MLSHEEVLSPSAAAIPMNRDAEEEHKSPGVSRNVSDAVLSPQSQSTQKRRSYRSTALYNERRLTRQTQTHIKIKSIISNDSSHTKDPSRQVSRDKKVRTPTDIANSFKQSRLEALRQSHGSKYTLSHFGCQSQKAAETLYSVECHEPCCHPMILQGGKVSNFDDLNSYIDEEIPQRGRQVTDHSAPSL